MPNSSQSRPPGQTPGKQTVKQARGQVGEDAAAQFLKSRGYSILARNWRPGHAIRGEIDCIAWQGRTLCFIEVKTRSSNEQGRPQEAVNFTKQRQICRLANAYVSFKRLDDTPCRFDVVEVWLNQDGSVAKVSLCPNAFDYITEREHSRRQRF